MSLGYRFSHISSELGRLTKTMPYSVHVIETLLLGALLLCDCMRMPHEVTMPLYLNTKPVPVSWLIGIVAGRPRGTRAGGAVPTKG